MGVGVQRTSAGAFGYNAGDSLALAAEEELSTQRVILPDCCEDWILAYGAFYPADAEFTCLECGGGWQKLAAGRFQSRLDGRTWILRARRAEDQEYRYLEAEDGQNPLTPRCCARIILAHGERLPRGSQFNCPICGANWRKDEIERGPHRTVTAFVDEGREVAVAIQDGATRRFLVPAEEYQPWTRE